MKKMIMVAGLLVACSASAQFLQNLTQALVQPEPAPAPAQPVQVAQPQTVVQQQVVQPAVQQVTTTTVQPVQQVTTTTVVPAAPVVAPAPVVVVPRGYQTCPRCGGRGKEEHAMGFKVKRCKLCGGKGFLRTPIIDERLVNEPGKAYLKYIK